LYSSIQAKAPIPNKIVNSIYKGAARLGGSFC
jgi:hypothetical protein